MLLVSDTSGSALASQVRAALGATLRSAGLPPEPQPHLVWKLTQWVAKQIRKMTKPAGRPSAPRETSCAGHPCTPGTPTPGHAPAPLPLTHKRRHRATQRLRSSAKTPDRKSMVTRGFEHMLQYYHTLRTLGNPSSPETLQEVQALPPA